MAARAARAGRFRGASRACGEHLLLEEAGRGGRERSGWVPPVAQGISELLGGVGAVALRRETARRARAHGTVRARPAERRPRTKFCG